MRKKKQTDTKKEKAKRNGRLKKAMPDGRRKLV
jgi:hypothetical protein